MIRGSQHELPLPRRTPVPLGPTGAPQPGRLRPTPEVHRLGHHFQADRGRGRQQPSRMCRQTGPGDRRRGRRAVRAALDRPSRPASTDSTPPGCDCVTSSVTCGRRRTAPYLREALPLADGVSEGSLALDRLGLGDRPRDVAGRVRRIAGAWHVCGHQRVDHRVNV